MARMNLEVSCGLSGGGGGNRTRVLINKVNELPIEYCRIMEFARGVDKRGSNVVRRQPAVLSSEGDSS